MVRRDAKMDRLSRVPLFSACNRKELGSLASRADEVNVPTGTALVREGDIGREFFVIVDGTAVVTRGGREVTRLGPGDYFGELALLDGQRRDATVTATSVVDALCVGWGEFHGLLADLPQLARKVMVGMATRLHELDAKN
jgi:CRP/FNR family cyclic AMP-dependent transcriptional regulator